MEPITTGQGSMALSDLVRAEEQGLDLNRLLFVKYLVLTRRLTDDLAADEGEAWTVPAAA